MAEGNEMILVLPFPLFRSLAERVGVRWRDETTPTEFSDLVVDQVAERIGRGLIEAHLAIIRQRFGRVEQAVSEWGRVYIQAHTPQGPREFSPFGLALYGDEDEMGDVWPNDFVVGVKVSGRYFPTWLDWQDPHGGGQMAYTCFVDDPAMREMMAEAKAAISHVVPEFEGGVWVIKMIHY